MNIEARRIVRLYRRPRVLAKAIVDFARFQKVYWRRPVPDRGYRRFLLLSSPRSGTHMLLTSLDSHPHIVCHTEAFNPDYISAEAGYGTGDPARRILHDYIYRVYPPHVGAVGFALHRYGARFGPWPDLWWMLLRDRGMRIIALHRGNVLQQRLSVRLAAQRREFGEWRLPIEISTGEFESACLRQETHRAYFQRWFQFHKTIEMTYEDLCQDFDSQMTRVQAFLGVPLRLTRLGVSKAPTPEPEEAIRNFKQLRDAFAATRWRGCFEDRG